MGFWFELNCVRIDDGGRVIAALEHVLAGGSDLPRIVSVHVTETGGWVTLAFEPGDLLCRCGKLERPRLAELAKVLATDAFWFLVTEYDVHVLEADRSGDYRYAGSKWFGDGPKSARLFDWSAAQSRGHCVNEPAFSKVTVGRTLAAAISDPERTVQSKSIALVEFLGFDALDDLESASTVVSFRP